MVKCLEIDAVKQALDIDIKGKSFSEAMAIAAESVATSQPENQQVIEKFIKCLKPLQV